MDSQTTRRAATVAITGIAAATLLTGCVYRRETVAAPPAASPPTTVVVAPQDRTVSHPEGRWELRGEGSATSPYYWIWIPAGATPPNPPPPPRLPR